MRSNMKHFVKHIAAVLAALLLVPLFILGASAEEIELHAVTVTGISAPQAGVEPARELTAVEEGVTVGDVKWFYSTTTTWSTFREISGKFGGVPYYAVAFTLFAGEGVRFATDCEVLIDGIGTVNSDNIEYTADGLTFTALYVFDNVVGDVLTGVTVGGFITPQPGKTPCTVDDLTVSEGMVADQLLWNEQGGFAILDGETVFEEGKVYEATLWLKTKEGVVLSSDTAFSVGPVEALCDYRDEVSLCLKMTLVCAEAADTVFSLEILKEPDKGTYTAGERFDPKGMVISAVTAVGEIELQNGEGMEFDPEVLNTTGMQTVTGTYKGKSVTFDLMVMPNPLGNVKVAAVTDLREPEAGKKAKSTFTFTCAPEGSATCRMSWYWFSEAFEYEPFTGTFEAGGKYAAYFFLTPEEGYKLEQDSAEFTVNGVHCVLKTDENGGLIMIRYFDEVQPGEDISDKEITGIDVRGVKMPERGRYPDLTGITLPANAPYTILECIYVSENVGEWAPYTDPFALGHYGIRLVLHASDGYVFDEPSVLLDGASCKAECTVSGKTATVVYDLVEIRPTVESRSAETDPPATEPLATDSQSLPAETDPVTPKKPSSFPVFPLVLCILLAFALAVALFFLMRNPRDE